MDGLVNFIIDVCSDWNKDIVVFIISLLPILELRGGLLAATLLGIEFGRAFWICILGNLFPIPLVLFLLEFLFILLKKWNFTAKLVEWFEKKVLSKREQIDKYGYLGLLLFVGIPLPGTGAWTGSALAVLLGLDRKKSFIFITFGVLLAAVIMSILSYGILGNLI